VLVWVKTLLGCGRLARAAPRLLCVSANDATMQQNFEKKVMVMPDLLQCFRSKAAS